MGFNGWMHGIAMSCHLRHGGAIRAQMASWTHIFRKILIQWFTHGFEKCRIRNTWDTEYSWNVGFIYKRLTIGGAGMWWYHHGHYQWHSKPQKHVWTANSLEGPPLVAGNALPRSYRRFSWWVFPWCSKYFQCLLVPSLFLCVFFWTDVFYFICLLSTFRFFLLSTFLI